MIKTVAYFPSWCAQNSKPVMESLQKSLSRAGVKILANDMQADAALIWSVLWAGRMSGNQRIYEHYKAQGRPIIIADVGTLRRGHTWKVAMDHVNALGYYGHTQDLDLDRPAKLKIDLRKQSQCNPQILIAAQHQSSLQMAGVTTETWINAVYHKLLQHTDRQIVVRPHPRSRLRMDHLPKDVILQSPTPVTGTYDAFDFDTDYHAVINYNSGPGILSALAGTRTIVDKTSLAHPVSIDIDHIEGTNDIDRSRWLIEICHTEYTLEEIDQGLWLKRLQKKLPILAH